MASNNFTVTKQSPQAGSYVLAVCPTQENNGNNDLITSGTVTDGLTSKYFTLVHWGVPYISQFGSSPHVSAAGGRLLYNVYTHYPFVFRSVPTWVHISDNLGHQIQEGQTIPASSARSDTLTTYFIDVDPNTGHTRDTYGTFNMGHYIGPNYSTLALIKSWIDIEQEAGEGVQEYIYFNPTAITFDATANTNDTKQVVVNSSSRWNGNLVLYDTNKFSISPNNGQSGETTVTITYLGEHNESASYRTMLNIYAIDGTSGVNITKAALRNPVEYNPINTSLTYNGGMIEFDVTVSNLAEYILSQTPGVTVGDTYVDIYFSPADWVWKAYNSGCTFYLNDVPSPVQNPPQTSDGFYTSSNGAVQLKLHEGTYNIKFTVPSSISEEEMDRWSYDPGTIGYSIFYQGGYYRFNSPTTDLYCYIFEDEEPVETNYIVVSPRSFALTSASTQGNQFSVSANTNWSATVQDPDWIDFTILYGPSGYTTGLTFDTEANTGSTRQGHITFTAGTATDSIIVGQQSAIIPDTIETNATVLGPASSAGTVVTLRVRSTADWTIPRYPRWVTISPLSGAASTAYTNVSINVSSNPGPSRSDFIQITAGTATPKVVSISQNANSNFIKIIPSAATYTSGLTRAGNLTVSASTDWRIVDKPSWVTFRSTTAMTSQTLTGGTSGNTTVWIEVDENTGDTRSGSAAFALENTSYSGFWTVTQDEGGLPDPEEGILHIYPEEDITDITSMGGYYSVLFENDDANAEDWLISYSDDWMQFYYDNQGNNPADYIYAGQTTYLFLKVNPTDINRSGAVIFTGEATGRDITLDIEQTGE